MTSAHVNGVLDLTFLDIQDESDFENGMMLRTTLSPSKLTFDELTTSINNSGANTITNTHTNNGNNAHTNNNGNTLSSPSKKEIIKAIRLSNNNLTSLDNVITSLINSGIDTTKVQWIDLSFNSLTVIPDDLIKLFPNLIKLYLHANKIQKLSEIKKLTELTLLKSVSFYGNPVEEHKHYRNYVLYHNQNLTQFDMSPITKTEIQRVSLFCVCSVSLLIC